MTKRVTPETPMQGLGRKTKAKPKVIKKLPRKRYAPRGEGAVRG